MRENEQLQTVATIAYYAAAGAVLYFCLRYVFVWVLPLLLGVGIAALLRPLVLRLAKSCRVGERFAACAVLFLFYCAAAGVLTLFLTIIFAQLYELLLRLPALYSESLAPLLVRLEDQLYLFAGRLGVSVGVERFSLAVGEALRQAAVDGSARLVGFAAGLAAKLPMLLLASIFTVMISAMTAAHYHEVGVLLLGLIPKKYTARVKGLQRFLRETVWQYLRAYTVIMAVTFLELLIGLRLLRFDYAISVAAAITLLDVLPLVGSGAALVPWGIVLLAGGDTAGGTGLLCLFGVIAIVRNIIEPRVVGKQLGLHPIITITAMYAGLQIAGVGGMLAAPVLVLLARHWRHCGG